MPRVPPHPEDVRGWRGIEIFVIDHRFLLKSDGLLCVSVPEGAAGILVVNDDVVGKSLPVGAAREDEWLPLPPPSHLLEFLEILLSQISLKGKVPGDIISVVDFKSICSFSKYLIYESDGSRSLLRFFSF